MHLNFSFFKFETDVNDKVIHLVQRLPPGSAPRVASGNSSESTSERRRNNDSGRNNMPGFFHVLDGTVMGALAIPMNTGVCIRHNNII